MSQLIGCPRFSDLRKTGHGLHRSGQMFSSVRSLARLEKTPGFGMTPEVNPV